METGAALRQEPLVQQLGQNPLPPAGEYAEPDGALAPIGPASLGAAWWAPDALEAFRRAEPLEDAGCVDHGVPHVRHELDELEAVAAHLDVARLFVREQLRTRALPRGHAHRLTSFEAACERQAT